MKILLLGKNGQVGWELQRTLAPLGEINALGRQELDLVDQQAIRRTVRYVKPDLIVNAAAYTAVDKAEEESELAMAVNGIAPGILAEEAVLCKAAMINYSTEYVFDGLKKEPYTEQDIPNPINVYGKTKLEGETAMQKVGVPHLIFRTSWVYGLRGSNFLLTILRLAKERDKLTIVNDQHGAPTWCRMIAEATAQVIAKGTTMNERQELFHLSAAGQTTWFSFSIDILKHACSILDGYQNPIMQAIRTEDYHTLAKRPKYSMLDNSLLKNTFGLSLPAWEISLKHVFECF